MNCRWIGGLVALACLTMVQVGAVSPAEDPVADRFSYPVGANPNSPNMSRYQGPDGRSYLGWTVHPTVGFLSPGYGRELQPGEDWGGRGGGDTDLGQPVYAAAAGTIVAAGYYGDGWGHIVLIRHTLPGGQVVLTQYAYMADIVKSSGTVEWREVIGHVGKTRSGSVLHFEVRQDDMLDFPPDYWPTGDGKDIDWVRAHYFAPSLFVRTHTRVIAPPSLIPPGGASSPTGGNNSSGGDPAASPGSSGAPGTGESAPVTPPPPPPPAPVWDGVQHLDGSVLKSAAGSYYLLQSGKKWPISASEVLATWARPEEALPATDPELASYPDAARPLGLREGALFKVRSGTAYIAGDPFDPMALVCWVVQDDQFAARGFSRSAVLPVSPSTADLYTRSILLPPDATLPNGILIKKPYGDYYLVDNHPGYLLGVHPVPSLNVLHSWQIDEATALTITNDVFWGRLLQLAPVMYRPGSILQSTAGQIFIVSGEYKILVPTMDVFNKRGYKTSNIVAATDAELALLKNWPTELR